LQDRSTAATYFISTGEKRCHHLKHLLEKMYVVYSVGDGDPIASERFRRSRNCAALVLQRGTVVSMWRCAADRSCTGKAECKEVHLQQIGLHRQPEEAAL
jgi:hypothetical protein